MPEYKYYGYKPSGIRNYRLPVDEELFMGKPLAVYKFLKAKASIRPGLTVETMAHPTAENPEDRVPKQYEVVTLYDHHFLCERRVRGNVLRTSFTYEDIMTGRVVIK